jgi:hypothetical protein
MEQHEGPDRVTREVMVRLTPEDHERFREACSRVERSMAAQGRVLIRDWLDEQRQAA